MSRKVEDWESDDERGVLSRTEGSDGVWIWTEGVLMVM